MYERAGDAAGKYTVPLLWDTVEETIVNNESSDIAYMLNSSFNEFAQNPLLDLYTEEDNEKLNDVIEWLSPLMIHGVYRCGFAKKQESYNRAMAELSAAFDRADSVLQRQRFLTGDTLTDADIRLFVTLFRFDEIYAVYFRANSRLVTLTPSLLNYCRDIYQMEGVADTCSMEHCKAHFYCSHAEWNKFSIIPHGLGFVNLLSQPHMRDELCEVEGEI
jgi:putative glutathione S-transferase